jgi:hypothetical protein
LAWQPPTASQPTTRPARVATTIVDNEHAVDLSGAEQAIAHYSDASGT